ncbi:MAG: PorT family protein [Bacteroidales bacterium]|nr:PorT family protein [Bacteroidales bacterium]
MKKLIIFILFLWLIQIWMFAQEIDSAAVIESEDDTAIEIVDDNEEGISIEMDEVVKEERKDTTRITIKDKNIEIIEKEDGTAVEIRDAEKKDGDDKKAQKAKKFKGHWTGLELGLNNFLDADFSMSRPAEYSWMDLNTGRSWNVNLNFHQTSVGIIGNRFGMVTGLGIEMNNYQFDGDNSIREENGVIVSNDLSALSLNKSKLTTTFLNVPLLLELQLGPEKRSKRFFIAGGVIGGLKLGSHTKIVYREEGTKRKEKDRDDFNINSLRYGFTLRAGYHEAELYAVYYPTTFFEKDKGPELYPFNVGISLGF